MIRVRDLIFEYPDKRVLHGLSFDVVRESVTALVGPNGSGKSTLMRCVAALQEPIGGTIHVAGVDALREPRRCHRELGYLSDFFGLYSGLTVRRSLAYMASAYGLPGSEVDAAVERAAERTQVTGHLDTKTDELSRGYRQRVAIAQAIIHDPKVLILDEPASGLDPEGRMRLSELFRTLRSEGMTLLVSSHILAELEDYSTHMLVLRSGRIVEQQALCADREDPSESWVIGLATADLEDARARLAEHAGVSGAAVRDGEIHFRFRGAASDRAELLRALLEHGIAVAALRPGSRDMQQAYLDLIRETEA